ncbi:MAG: HAD family hydrolase [Kaiparowitsia implicata GSE-PSE-MK54-09C]|jgi:phosphoglycolate phosphatase-like HAD superfamily hydrolase|nr:HAD family hydrolase [Kaiparowitsia implicata GSE-PSE-MK54-09C]
MLRIITDFDGPIMNVSERYYKVYQYCLEAVREPEQPIQQLSKSEFWDFKRSQLPEREIGQASGLTDEQAQAFATLRKQTVHTLPYLHHDSPIPGAVETLSYVQTLDIDLVVMTMRREQELDEALARCGLGRFFAADRRYCLSNDYVKTADIKDKPRLMARAMRELAPASTWMIGDTEADIAAAQAHNIPVIAVLSGIRDRSRLSLHNPNCIAANLQEAVSIVLDQSGMQLQPATPLTLHQPA